MPGCHYGKYCWDTTRDHWEKFRHPDRNGRKIIRLFHGTKCQHVNSIDKEALLPSPNGRLGRGIYLTVEEVAWAVTEAWAAAEDRNCDQCTYIVEVEVDVGQMKYLNEEADVYGKWEQEGFDSFHGIHPPWDGVWKHKFPEWCVADPERCTIKRHWVVNGKTKIKDRPHSPVYFKGGEVEIEGASGGVYTVKHKAGGFKKLKHNQCN